jgi:hypothetical protein
MGAKGVCVFVASILLFATLLLPDLLLFFVNLSFSNLSSKRTRDLGKRHRQLPRGFSRSRLLDKPIGKEPYIQDGPSASVGVLS